MEQFKLTIVIAAYNIEKYINACVDSVIEGFPVDTEIIIINDGSTDNTLQKLDKYKTFANIKVVSQENQGLSAVRNNGLKLAQGKYIIFVDGDDYVDKKSGEMLMPLIDSNYDVIVSNLYRDYGNRCEIRDILKNVNKQKNKLNYFIKYIFKPAIQRYVVKVDVLRENNLIFPIGLLHEDQYWSNKLTDIVEKQHLSIFFNDTECWYYYRQDREGSIMTVKETWENLYCMMQISIMLKNENVNPILVTQVRRDTFGFIRGFYNENNPKDKVEDLITFANNNKDCFKHFSLKHLPFYLVLKCFGFEVATKLFKMFIIN